MYQTPFEKQPRLENQDPLETQESFRQNPSFAEKILPISGMLPSLSDDHDIRKVTREKVEELLYAEAKVQEPHVAPQNRPGPSGVNRWIWENKIMTEIRSKLLQEYLLRGIHHKPVVFYSSYSSVLNLLRHMTVIYQIPSWEIQDEHLMVSDLCDRILQSSLRPPVARTLLQYLQNKRTDAAIEISPIPSSRQTITLHTKIEQYQLNLKQKGYSQEHIRHSVANARVLLTWLCRNIQRFADVSPLTIAIFQITNEDLLAYRSFKLRQVKAGNCSPVTFCHVISAIRSFFYYLQKHHGYVPPLQRFRAIKAPRYKTRELPTDGQIKHFFRVVDQYAEDPIRDQIGYRLLLELGLRLSEAAKVKWGDINLGVRTITIHSKGKRSHTLPLVGRLFECIKQVYNQQSAHELVLGTSTASIVDKLYQCFKWYALIAGWPFEGGVHFFRHIFITRLARKQVLPQTLKELARVSRLDTVSLYMHLGQNDRYLTNQINRLHYD